MSISSSMNAGVTGLSVNAIKLATISDNIANSATNGYKRADADFSSIVVSDGGGGGAYTAGGVRVSTSREIDQQGTLVTTSNATDISIAGAGMLPVTQAAALNNADGDLPFMLTTTGSFSTDEDGVLRTSSGLALMGWPADTDGSIPVAARDSAAGLEPVIVNLNQFASDPTTEVRIGANLPATNTQAGASGDPLELPVEYFDNLGASQTLTLTFTPTVPASGSSNEWTLEVTDSATGAGPIAEFVITFDDTRTLGGAVASVTPVMGGTYDPVTGAGSITVAGGPIDLMLGAVGSNEYLTQLASEFAPVSITKDGTPVGSLSTVRIDENGLLQAVYSSGFTRTLYQIPVVDVVNPNGLDVMDSQTYAISQSSGGFYLWDAGDGPTGGIMGYTLEESTTDVAGELTSLIQTQRAYSSSAKVIQTVDEMLQETTNLKR